MNWGAHEVDGRIAARAAVKLRAALRQSIDAKRLFQLYKESDPLTTDNEAQDNARARAWAMINMLPNNQALINALMYLWAEAFVLGEDSANEALRQARQAKKAPETGVDWANWKPGDRASALLIAPPKAFQSLLSRSGLAIRGLDKTGYDRVGTALSRSIRLGLGDTNAAKLINDAIGDPARALTIAITETNRAVSLGAMKTYREAGLEKMEWAVSDPCPECAQNQGQVVEIGGTFNSGAQQPPAHPNCRCALLPVLPEYETNELGVRDVAPQVSGPTFGGVSEGDLLVVGERLERNKQLPFSKRYAKGDEQLSVIYEIKGYNGLPTVVDADTFASMSKKADFTLYRGVLGTEAKRYADDFKTGEHYAGQGFYGNGTYASTNRNTALEYAGLNTRGILEGKPGGEIMEILIPDATNFVTYTEMKNKVKAITKAIDDFTKKSLTEVSALSETQPLKAKELRMKIDALLQARSAMRDPGQAAVLLGYDGLIIDLESVGGLPGEKYVVILNRAKVVVKK